MTYRSSGGRGGRLASTRLVGVIAGVGALTACAQIVGITDTAVSEDAGVVEGGGGSMPEAAGDGLGAGLGPDVENGADGLAPPGDGSMSVDSSLGLADATDDQGGDDGGGCTANMTRCGPSGRQICQSNQWQADPCPINQPTCTGGQCSVRGPTMVAVSSFYVDSTEVTAGDYQLFLTAKGTDTSGQPSVCSWNTTYQPAQALNPSSYPVTNVDWCDALAYCTWAGKHLCGQIGGGPIAIADALTASDSQWFLACGGPGGSSHPNSNSVCNSSMGTGDLAPVASFPGCEGFYTGLFDLEGNAAEWVDSCDTTDAGGMDTCHLLGGSFIDEQSYCTESFDEPRNTAAYPLGFRCCAG